MDNLHDSRQPQDLNQYGLGEFIDNTKNTKLLVFRLLGALKYFYSFKELEERLGVPAQILWRYVVLRTVPERSTAEKILKKIRENRMIEDVLVRYFRNKEELWSLLSNPGIMMLTGLKFLEELKDEKINSIVTSPENYSAALGSIFSTLFHTRLCISSHSPYSNHIISKNYKVSPEYFDVIILPKECIPKKSKVALVAIDGNKITMLSSLMDLINSRQSYISGLLLIVGSRSRIDELLRSRSKRSMKSVILIDLDKVRKGNDMPPNELKRG
ncbi:MAG: hypothetical protein G5Z42_00230 [Caldisphaeraceae archaeon]|nr:hypothetical protein [Caldisphaeraceae archaeon]MEB3692060.1 hypothetical protein [Caldisphaeraceae archaeon]MEB3797231.1 hypothetical protein [Caldisphaeraceae archaeon]